jgi:hypothetical protein
MATLAWQKVLKEIFYPEALFGAKLSCGTQMKKIENG